jgi:hypothetical protein
VVIGTVSVAAASSDLTVPSFVPVVLTAPLATSRQLVAPRNVGSGQDIRNWHPLLGLTLGLPRDGRLPRDSGSISALHAASAGIS